jgi:aspartate/methionine/tyrosine aminotransferase
MTAHLPGGDRSPYITWAKRRPSLPFDLAVSNVLACTLDDLPGARDALALDGSSDLGYPPLVEAIAARYGVPTAQVATAAGTSGANLQVVAALVAPGDDVLVERPGYDPLAAAVRLVGGRPLPFERTAADGFALDPDRVRAAVTPRTRLIVVTNLHNPSGVLASPESLAAVGRLAESIGARVLVDEVYLDAADGHAASAVTLGPSFAITSSLTKSYGLGSLRCGWVVAAPEVAEAVRGARDVVDGSGSIVTERLGALAFSQLAHLAGRSEAHLRRNRPLVDAFLAARGDLECAPADGGTVAFPRVIGLEDTAAFAADLAEAGVAVVPGHFFGAASHFRIGWGGPTEVVRDGLGRLGAALDRRSGAPG